jgi:SAM-dependent methyltransferase
MSFALARDLARRAAGRVIGRKPTPILGCVRLGDLDGVSPICPYFGYSRGKPVDRYYIEKFLERHRGDISGHVLEIGDDTYCRRFGSGITRQDILHVSSECEDATIVGDLSQPGVLEDNSFDCMVLTQTLQFIYDMPSAVRHIHRALKPGGVALVTVPGISSADSGGDWGHSWYWALTLRSLQRLMEDVFGPPQAPEGHGNVYAATCFLQGLAVEEVEHVKLDVYDPSYPVILAQRAIKS